MSNNILLSNDIFAIFEHITTTIQILNCIHMKSKIAFCFYFLTHFAHPSSFGISICTRPVYCNYLFVFSIYSDFSTQLYCRLWTLDRLRSTHASWQPSTNNLLVQISN